MRCDHFLSLSFSRSLFLFLSLFSPFFSPIGGSSSVAGGNTFQIATESSAISQSIANSASHLPWHLFLHCALPLSTVIHTHTVACCCHFASELHPLWSFPNLKLSLLFSEHCSVIVLSSSAHITFHCVILHFSKIISPFISKPTADVFTVATRVIKTAIPPY